MGKNLSIWLQNRKRCAMLWNEFLRSTVFFVWCLVFVIWSILYITFVMHSGKFSYGLCPPHLPPGAPRLPPQALDAYGTYQKLSTSPPESCGKLLICPRSFQCIFPMVAKIWILKLCRKKFEDAYPIQNIILKNLALHIRFNIPDG